MPRRPTLLVLLASLVCLGMVGPAPRAAEPPPAPPGSPVRTIPVSEIRPGMEATVRSVFEGDRVEEFQAEIVGIMDNFLGPGQDLILARLKGPRVEFTGVAAGMSGSPVYIDGRLAGAVSYRLGAFLKEPIAGVTPIQAMLDVGTGGEGRSASAALLPDRSAAIPEAMAGRLEPIETPIMVSGVPARALDLFAEDLSRLGLGRMVPGAAAATGGSAGGAAPGAGRSGPPLLPGEPVAMKLVGGDISLAATGTVTHVDGDRVYAFGHPGFLNGATEVPMARAEIYLTLASLQASTKMGRVLDTIGTFKESRLPAITGVIGPGPRMIPVTVTLESLEGNTAAPAATAPGAPGGRGRSYHYEVLDHRDFTPPIVGLLTAASLINTPSFADEMTLSLSGRIGLEGHPDLLINDLYTGLSAAQPAAATLARDVQALFGVVFQNRFEAASVRSIDLRVGSVEQGRLSVVEGVYPTRTEVQAGEEAEFRVLIRRFRGDTYTRKFTYRVPEGTPGGTLSVFIGGANLIAASERNLLARQVSQADDLDQLIKLINRLRTSDRLYMKITRRQGGAVVLSEVMPSLPPSILATLAGSRGTGEVTPLAETTLHEEEIPVGEIVVGGTMVPLNVH